MSQPLFLSPNCPVFTEPVVAYLSLSLKVAFLEGVHLFFVVFYFWPVILLSLGQMHYKAIRVDL